ncbi:MAG: AAA family ATPase [Pseudomonadota bacterium]|nr:AAA family ATPase [Pseudomonadota bacterium]
MDMKKPPQKLIDDFLQWYRNSSNKENEDFYHIIITRDHLAGMSESDFIKFFQTFAHEGGKVQSGGYRTSGALRRTVEENYTRFRSFIMRPFDEDFDEAKWLTGIKGFKHFGIGLATIYLNRVDKERFPVLNNKATEAIKLLGVSLPTDNVKRYKTLREAHQQLISWFPSLSNFFQTDALAQFLIGEEAGRPWKETLANMSAAVLPEDASPVRFTIWKISHGKKDFTNEQRRAFQEDHTVHVHKDTGKGQGTQFLNEMKEGDLFYLCHGNDNGVRFFGKITSPPVRSAHAEGFVQRSYEVLFQSVQPTLEYSGVRKGWSPNYNSTCMKVPDKEINLFEVEILIPFFGKRLSDIPGFSGRSVPEASLNEAFLPSKNIILYGPPGTGKTFMLRNKYKQRFTETQVISREHFAQELVEELTWLQVITMVLYDLGPVKASDIFKHPLLQAKIRLSSNQNPKNTIWAWLQRHTKIDCLYVKYAQRSEPMLFSKDEKSVWTVDREIVEEQFPELIERLRSLREFKPVNKEIRRFEYVTFHQSYSYEDFVEGIKPVMSEGVNEAVAYEIKPGIFRSMVEKAQEDPDHGYALLIDEINRGNVANIFGELIALIEDDKRMGASNELRARLPYSRQEFVVPDNLFIIGAMNTADRSVEALDTALRRRFTFIITPPQPELVQQPANFEVDLQKLLYTINARIEKILDKDHCIGHSYFMDIARNDDPLEGLRRVFATKVLPLLEEYFYGNPAKIGMILGKRFVVRKDVSIDLATGEWGMDEYEERSVYTLVDPMSLDSEDFCAIYE